MATTIQRRLREESGTIYKEASELVALTYPSPYSVGMSSLGFQTIYREINAHPRRAAHRAFHADSDAGTDSAVLMTYEGNRPVGNYPVIALSVAFELELTGVIECLKRSGLPPLAEDRDDRHPFVLAGGPLTFSNPLPLAPFVDAILMGEAEETIHRALDIVFAGTCRASICAELAREVESCFIPTIHGDFMPMVAKADDSRLPAFAAIRTPNTELRDMFLIEPERGCHRGCAYCVMRRSTNGGMRLVDRDRVLALIPEDARRVGLVGAAVTDHPQITEIVEALVSQGREIGISSLRADRLTDRLVAALRAGGYRTLTTASDGASQRLRERIQRRAREEHLLGAAKLARAHGMERLKLYMMVGVPDENEDDIDELARFSTELSRIVPVSLGIAPFVAKRNTPLDGSSFAGISVVNQRLTRLRRGVRGRVDLRPTSARWAWVEYLLAQGGRAEGRAVLSAVEQGGRFRHFKDALEALPTNRPRRLLVQPGNRLAG